jgi:hypothetical protein
MRHNTAIKYYHRDRQSLTRNGVGREQEEIQIGMGKPSSSGRDLSENLLTVATHNSGSGVFSESGMMGTEVAVARWVP